MLFLVTSAVLVLSSLLSSIQCVEVLDGCNEVLRTSPNTYKFFKLSNFENNLSKSFEVFRLKMAYRGDNFVFGFYYDNPRIYMIFGPYKESFGVYKSLEANHSKTEPCQYEETKVRLGSIGILQW